MLTLGEYMAMQKQQDKLNEFEVANRPHNLKVAINYVLDYFNDYLEAKEAKVELDRQRSDKFRSQLEDYSLPVQDWLVDTTSTASTCIDPSPALLTATTCSAVPP